MDRASRPTIRDVARNAGVSPGCVSNVMNGRRSQDDPIGQAVMAAVQELGYRRNSMASNLRRSNSRIVGLVIPDFENPFFAELVARLELHAESSGYRIVATSSRETPAIEAREIDELIGWRVAGILLIPALGSDAGEIIRTNRTPFVVLDRIFADSGFDEIGVNNAEATADAMRRLIALGHRRILVAYLDNCIGNVAERLQGARRAAGNSGAELIVDYVSTGGTVASARAAIARHLDANPEPTAIFTLFNTATLAAFGLIHERGLVLGRNIALVGFDDSAWMSHVHPPVAAIVQPVDEIASVAWKRLAAKFVGGKEPGGTSRVACRFEPRGTMVAALDKMEKPEHGKAAA